MGLGKGPNTVLGTTYVVEQPVFSIVPLILTFDFDLILGLFFYFWGPNWLFFWSGYVSITVLWSIYVVDQLLFSMITWILIFDFDLILGLFLTFFWGPNGLFLGLE